MLNVHYLSSKKLVLVDPDQAEVAVSDAMQQHLFRFESYPSSGEWLLTDIDNALGGNPYFPK